MDEEECEELMRYTQDRLSDTDLDDLASLLFEELGGDSPRWRGLLHMLETLDADLRCRDAQTARRILKRIGATAHTSDGSPPEGLWLDLAPGHRDLFGTDGVDLRREAFQLGHVIEELRVLRQQLQRELG
jgi:hypothetical protein